MPPLQLLIKPASSACNMRCDYCFYHSIAQNRDTYSHGIMQDALLDTLIKNALSSAEGFCTFAFQGGEPTLAGLDFFERVVNLQKKHNTKKLSIQNTIQTNGYTIDDEWAKFLAESRFLVGVSLDGNSEVHNLNRLNAQGKPTFNRIMQSVERLRRHGAEFNILSVVTAQNAKRIASTYSFFKKQDFRHLQFIPHLDEETSSPQSSRHALSSGAYAKFLIDLFRLWHRDFMSGNYFSIRHIDNWVRIAAGQAPEACAQRGHCSVQFVVESDGSVYPCDFYAYDSYKIGMIGTDSWEQMATCDAAKQFVAASLEVPPSCKECPYFQLCRNGCRRERTSCGDTSKNIHCDAYLAFFSACLPEIKQVANIVRRGSRFR